MLIPTVAKVDAALLTAAPRLRLIVQPAAGYQNIDTAAARYGNFKTQWTELCRHQQRFNPVGWMRFHATCDVLHQMQIVHSGGATMSQGRLVPRFWA